MSHVFDGTWSHFKIAVLGVPPNLPIRGEDFNLAINDAGVIDPSSTVDGRKVQSGTATAKTIDLIAEGRHYAGHYLKTVILDSKPIIIMAGRFVRVPVTLDSKAKGKAAVVPGQNEGDWVITKP
jgi:hypothetical protein